VLPNPDVNKAEPKPASSGANSKPSIKRGGQSGNPRGGQRLGVPRSRQERELRAEGEAAKETLLLALSIASSALSDAQKAVSDGGVKP
jgi:hypothetical protein